MRKKKPMAVYELIAEGVADEATRRRVQRYEEALRLYQSQRWAEAERLPRSSTFRPSRGEAASAGRSEPSRP